MTYSTVTSWLQILSQVLCKNKRSTLIWLVIILSLGSPVPAQTSGHTLFGDIKVDESKVDGLRPMSLDVILYNLAGIVVSRQRVSNNGRYRFLGLRPGEYDIVVEVENLEVARLRVSLGGGTPTDFRHDLEFEWKSNPKGPASTKAQNISVAQVYERTPANQSLFEKGQSAVDNKKYAESMGLFRQIVDNDQKDFQAWTELGTVFLLQDKKDDAERAYLKAIEAKPDFLLALLNLGRVQALQKKFEASIDPLTRAVEIEPRSADAHLLLGEAYLQIRKGSKAVHHLEEAARLGRPEGHLRLATLYNAAGMKDKAVTEYEEFLKKSPNHPERKAIEKYITANKSK